MKTSQAELPVCPNCGQWQHPTGNGYSDCFHECVKLGFVEREVISPASCKSKPAPNKAQHSDEVKYQQGEISGQQLVANKVLRAAKAQHSIEIKPIPGFNGYLATSSGEIVSAGSDWRGQGQRVMHKMLDTYGYPTVRLQIGRERRTLKVHRLVLLAFNGMPPTTECEARHLNGIRHDNRSENLAWGTRKENAADREAHGNTVRGENHSKIIRQGIREKEQAAAKLIVRAVNGFEAERKAKLEWAKAAQTARAHSNKMAEALQGLLDENTGWNRTKAAQALSAYEAAQ